MARTQPVELVTMVLVTDPTTNRVLVEDKRHVPWKAGHSFPGGHVEVGESCAAAAIREVYEETGLRLTAVSFCGTCEWFDTAAGRRKLGLLYRGQDFSGQLQASDEGEIHWLPMSDLTPDNTATGLPEMLRVFNREIPAVVSGEWNGDLAADTGQFKANN
ncbi:8-oxo-dGTP diphosphatase [Levilactobacillus tangyuanensis]|uniref:8-oxo-dGTP diphosphatase n=1 Tax=Levilactobacillus tangyuanensis TaxID=2486021 RepID=A0ABW1TMD1_9LACO|nr:NUDIX domain-containing protein [Levilactobacillus tangyuanensis]